ncbi:MAG: WecB/TagA/CpsF family glycosyltransferase [Steroidobacteraceae bacterium]
MTTPYWLLGAPFDAITLSDIRDKVFAAADSREQLIFATPNVHFLTQASWDPRFREDILRTGLSLVDGMPVVWLGVLLGVPFGGRVAGSDLLESLIVEPGPRPLRVFFFGGEEGAAEAAVQAVQTRGGGLRAVGAHFPGFVSVEEMSSDAVIDEINRSDADLLVVALGAVKGHRWMEANRNRLRIPVICHLGAAINFVSGRLRRAPRFLQQVGLEWLWRIKEEPALFPRYARDAQFLLRAVAGSVLPELIRRPFRKRRALAMQAIRHSDGRMAVSVNVTFGTAEVAAMQQMDVAELTLIGITRLDATGVGWLYASRYRRAKESRLLVYCDPISRETLRRWRADFLITDF